ncbi:MAG: hypothetical protein KJ984_03830 [Nanoarchaeota archaeon]|nr:hypothetical protein [Nanoarchaeota archaeon]
MPDNIKVSVEKVQGAIKTAIAELNQIQELGEHLEEVDNIIDMAATKKRAAKQEIKNEIAEHQEKLTKFVGVIVDQSFAAVNVARGEAKKKEEKVEKEAEKESSPGRVEAPIGNQSGQLLVDKWLKCKDKSGNIVGWGNPVRSLVRLQYGEIFVFAPRYWQVRMVSEEDFIILKRWFNFQNSWEDKKEIVLVTVADAANPNSHAPNTKGLLRFT